jgi:tetratricopeptide (TPR) repeat protein
MRGIALAHLSDCDLAIPALERGLTGSQDSPIGIFFVSWCYAQQAGNIAKRMENTGVDPALGHVMRGDVLLRLQGDSNAAIDEYRNALAARGRDVSILERLAEAQLSAGQIDGALGTAQSVLQLDPRRISPKRTLVEIAMRERNYKAALPYLREMVVSNPADVPARVQLGTACAETGLLEEALQNLSPALERGYPDQKGTLHYLLGTVLRKLGRPTESARAFETAQQLSDASQRVPHQEQNVRP